MTEKSFVDLLMSIKRNDRARLRDVYSMAPKERQTEDGGWILSDTQVAWLRKKARPWWRFWRRVDDYERNQEAARALWPALAFARETTPEAGWGVFVDDGKAALEVCASGADGKAWCVLCPPPHEPFDEGAEALIRWAADKALSTARDSGS